MLEVDKKTDHDFRREGLFARALGRPVTANPYISSVPEGILWEEGWRMIDEGSDPHPMKSSRTVPDFVPGPSQLPSRREAPRAIAGAIFIAAAIVALIIGITFALLR